MIPDSVQAKVLAQAQAISAALATGLKQQQQQSTATPATSSTAAVVDKKEALKKLVDNIPTRKYAIAKHLKFNKVIDVIWSRLIVGRTCSPIQSTGKWWTTTTSFKV